MDALQNQEDPHGAAQDSQELFQPLSVVMAQELEILDDWLRNDAPMIIDTLGPFDIAHDRPGNFATKHEANLYFLYDFLARNAVKYSCQRPNNRRLLAWEILGALEGEGYRFFERSGGGLRGWIEITDFERKVKIIMHTLKDRIKKGLLPSHKQMV